MNRTTARTLRVVVAAGLIGMTVGVVGGCRTRLDFYRANISPEQQAPGEREVDIENRHVYVGDTNLRNLRWAVDKALLLDRPISSDRMIP